MTGPRTIMPKKHIIIKTYQKYSKIIKTYQNNHKHIQTIPNPSKSQTIPKQSQKFPKHPKPSKHIQTIPNISKPFQIHQNISKPNVSGPAAGTRKAWKMLLCMLLGLEPSYCQNLCNTSTVCERKSHEKLKIGTGMYRTEQEKLIKKMHEVQ